MEVKEHYGLCAVCCRRKELGNGLCLECWDKYNGEYPAPTKNRFIGDLKKVSRKINKRGI